MSADRPPGPGRAPGAYRVTARLLEPGRSEVRCAESVIGFDSSPQVGGVLPGPAELLGAAFAACMLKNVERFSAILPFRQTGARVDVVLERRDAPPAFTRITYELWLVTDEDPRRVDLLHRNLQRHGAVFNTLAAACEVEGTVSAAPPATEG